MSSGAPRVTPVAVSQTSTLVNQTGSWKYIQPVRQDRVAPCNEACPVGVDIEGYMNLLREGRTDEARDLLLRENPMPAVTGRVCHHPCELGCNRRHFDAAVAIHAVERALGDLTLEAMPPVPPPAATRGTVGVVGSGPAGLACGYHLARLGYDVTVFEAAAEPGGMLRLGIPAYRLPRDILDRQIEWIKRHGVRIRCNAKIGTDVPWWSLLRSFDAVFLGIGAHQSRPLGVPGEDLAGVRSGLAFLRSVNACTPPPVGRRAVIVGGGNTAIDCARAALRLGAEATVVYRRTRAEMPAIAEEVDEAEREGVRILFLAAPVELHGSSGRLSAVRCVRMRLGSPDASGRPRPVPLEGEEFTLPADTVLSAIGESADLASLPPDVERDSSGVTVDWLATTRRAAVFAGGDMTRDPRSVADALGAGKRAAIGIDRHLRRRGGDRTDGADPAVLRWGARGNLSITRWRGDDPVTRASPVNEVVSWDDINPRHFVTVPRRAERHLAVEGRHETFVEVNRGLDRDVALEEARRCFNCGVCNSCDLCLIFCPDVAIARASGGYHIALEYCKGCGICAAECPRGAITMTREGL